MKQERKTFPGHPLRELPGEPETLFLGGPAPRASGEVDQGIGDMKSSRIRPIEKAILGLMALITGIILVPSVLRFFDSARQSKCLSHLHQIGQALRIYWEDHREVYPPFVDDHGGRYYTGGVTALLPDYLKTTGALYCPKDRRPPRLPGYSSYNVWNAKGDGEGETITYNAFGWLENGGTVDLPGGWPAAASPTADGKIRPDLQQAWGRIGYRSSQWPCLANGNAPPHTIALLCLRHSRRGDDPTVLILRLSGETELALLKEVNFISQQVRPSKK